MKGEFEMECKICARPFTVFRWKPGADARYKKTEICQTCAKVKNVCQTCLLDLEYHLPVQVRDMSTGSGNVPQSDVMREWQAMQNERMIANGELPFQSATGRIEMRNQLVKLARTSPYYKRNQAHVCSFFVKGECKRGQSCPYRHELPDASSSSSSSTSSGQQDLSKQNIKDRYYGVNDPVANKIINKSGVTTTTNNITPPQDKDIKTLFLSNVLANTITDQDIKDKFYSYGELQDVKIVEKSNCAFVTYTTRSSAESAIQELHNNLIIKDIPIKVYWSNKEHHTSDTKKYNNNNNNNTASSHKQSASTENTTVVNPYSFAPPSSSFKPQYASMNPNQLGATYKKDR